MLKNLQKFRQKIDQIDEKILKNLAERFKVTKKIGQYKVKHFLSLEDKKRELEMLKFRKVLAKKLGLDKKLIEEIFKLILKKVKIEHLKIKK